jgi:hypothetical protein
VNSKPWSKPSSAAVTSLLFTFRVTEFITFRLLNVVCESPNKPKVCGLGWDIL